MTCAPTAPHHTQWPWCLGAEAGHSLHHTGARLPHTTVLRAVSTLSRIRCTQRFVMGSQTGMSPKLSPEPLKMSLPSINCHDSKTNGRSLKVCSPRPPFVILSPPPSLSFLPSIQGGPPPDCLQGCAGHSDLIGLHPGEADPPPPRRRLTHEGGGGLINARG